MTKFMIIEQLMREIEKHTQNKHTLTHTTHIYIWLYTINV